MRAGSMPYGRMVTVCPRSRRRGLQRTRSGRTPLQLGQHRQPPPSRRATAAGIPSMAVWYALGARRTSTPRHVGHWATTRQSRTRCQTGDLARECRCQIIWADLVVISFGDINGNLGPRNSSCALRVPNKISSPPRDGIVDLCSPTQSAQRHGHCTGVDIRGRAGSDLSAPDEF